MSSARTGVLLALCLAVGAPHVGAQTMMEEMLHDLDGVAEKYVALANAMPESSYDWRPEDGVRSVAEVYMHMVGANYGLAARFWDAEIPADVPATWYRDPDSVTDKETIVGALETSFEFLAASVKGISTDDLDAKKNLFGRDTNLLGVLMLVQTHCHEHLGQAIAYARTNHVTPPWSGM